MSFDKLVTWSSKYAVSIIITDVVLKLEALLGDWIVEVFMGEFLEYSP
jgi:hypothetical protein